MQRFMRVARPENMGYTQSKGDAFEFLVDVEVREVERRMRTEGIDCAEAIRRELGVNPFL